MEIFYNATLARIGGNLVQRGICVCVRLSVSGFEGAPIGVFGMASGGTAVRSFLDIALGGYFQHKQATATSHICSRRQWRWPRAGLQCFQDDQL